ncbi:MAG TPA: cytochrome c biogenesis protein CcdA [Streptosporangiaceae bacterium]|nr:cytochrome c biogenesis protein CcdA [Streptosporangiaceae bacterium]
MTADVPRHPSARIWLAAGVTAALLATVVAAGLRMSAAASGPLMFVESLSARVSGLFLLAGAKVPVGYALIAGMVAAVNPCGFVLLPAYLGYYLGDRDGGAGARGQLRRALLVSVTVTASFALLFGLAGILAGLAASALTSSLPYIGVTVGAGLLLLGGLLASGRELNLSLAPRMAQRFRASTRRQGLGGYLAYGAAYGLASLGCTLPVFLGVVGTSLQLHGLASAVGQFMLFGVGMGAVLTACTVTTAWLGDGLIKRARALGPHIGWLSAVLLWLAGAYVLYYWLTAIRLL